MRSIMLLLSLTFTWVAYSASVDVKDLDASEDTTIEIRKGKKKTDDAGQKIDKAEEKIPGSKWTTETDTVDINGDPAALASEARQDWKKKCDEWKKEFKESNKGAKIINLSCGSPTCSGDVGNKSCVSKATYKIKVKED